MRNHLLLFLIMSIFGSNSSVGQTFERANYELLDKNGQKFSFPWAGGLNSPQFSEADLNNDGNQDLVVFERTGYKILTFLNNGSTGADIYDFAPKYIKNFPKELRSWALMRDFNKDSAADIFAASAPQNQGLMVFRGFYDNNELKFKKINFTQGGLPIVFYQSMSNGLLNMVISSEDVPDFVDVNGDGDLDCVTFDPGGGFVDYFENQAIEKNLGLDSIFYKHLDNCWGRFFESGLTKASNLSGSPDTCASSGFAGEAVDRDGAHAGSTVCCFDQDGDGDQDMVLGDIAFDNLVFYKNCGTKNVAWMCQQDSMFPMYDVSAKIRIFPSSFYLDVNNDGRKDLIAAPNKNFFADDQQVAWLYNNVGTGNNQTFTLEQKSFLVDKMADQGTGAYPVFVDVNGDGLLDIISGNFGVFKGGGVWEPRLVYYKNVGTFIEPSFKIEDEDWLKFSQFSPNIINLQPTFGDMDEDGDLDLVVGEENGVFFYAKNISPSFGEPLEFGPIESSWLNIYGGTGMSPTVVDMNNDGKEDLVVGLRNGALRYYENTNTTQGVPSFVLKNALLGGVALPPGPAVDSYNAPTAVKYGNGKTELFLGTAQSGSIWRYSNIIGNTNVGQVFTKESEDFGGLREGFRLRPALADINKDGLLDMVVGNLAGGLTFYHTNISKFDGSISVGTDEIIDSENRFSADIYPNPTDDYFTIHLNNAENADWRAQNLLGQIVAAGQLAAVEATVNVQNWGAGVYFIEISSNTGRIVKKVVIR